MQVSALNLIIAAQQARAGSPASRTTPNHAPTERANAAAATSEPDTFGPLAFKAVDAAPAAANRPAANPFAAPVPLGSQIDIRV